MDELSKNKRLRTWHPPRFVLASLLLKERGISLPPSSFVSSDEKVLPKVLSYGSTVSTFCVNIIVFFLKRLIIRNDIYNVGCLCGHSLFIRFFERWVIEVILFLTSIVKILSHLRFSAIKIFLNLIPWFYVEREKKRERETRSYILFEIRRYLISFLKSEDFFSFFFFFKHAIRLIQIVQRNMCRFLSLLHARTHAPRFKISNGSFLFKLCQNSEITNSFWD